MPAGYDWEEREDSTMPNGADPPMVFASNASGSRSRKDIWKRGPELAAVEALANVLDMLGGIAWMTGAMSVGIVIVGAAVDIAAEGGATAMCMVFHHQLSSESLKPSQQQYKLFVLAA